VIAKGVTTEPDNPGAREAARVRAKTFLRVYGYTSVVFADAQGRIQLKVPADSPLSDASINRHVQAALQSPNIQISDLNRDTTNDPILMWLECPILSDLPAAHAIAGAVILVIDPHTFLYPAIKKWPAPSATAETDLVRRDGDEVVCLNDLRFRPHSALNVRVSITADPQMPAVKAVQGILDVLEGVDYRGAPVYLAARKIEGMPWFMVAKIDQEEVLAPLRQEAWNVGIITALLLLATLLGIGLLWRQQKLAYARANEARLQTLIEQAPTAISISREGKIIYVNRKFLDWYGYASLDELVGRSVTVNWAPEFRAMVAEFVRRRARGESVPNEYEGMARRKDGSQFPLHVAVASVELPDGAAWLSFITDITERQRAEQSLKLFRALIDHANDSIEVVDSETGRILDVNERALQLHGYNREEYLALTIPQIDPLFAAAGEKSWLAHLETLKRFGFSVFETAHRRKDGSIFPVEVNANYVRLERDYILAVVRDITERKQMEKDRRAAEERFRLLIENASDLVTAVNNRGVLQFVGPSAKRSLGYEPEELLHSNVFERIELQDAEKVMAALKQALSDSTATVSVEYRFKHKDGSWRILQSIGRSIPNQSPDGFVVVNSRDLTESRKLEAQLRQSQKMEAIGQLAGGVAHDFNNILAVIQLQSALLKTSANLSPEQSELADDIGDSTQRAAALTRQLLLFSRQETARMRDLDLSEAVNGLTRMLQRVIGANVQVQFKFTLETLRVHADAGMLDQVLMNLVVNARDAMPGGGKIVIEISGAEFDELSMADCPQARIGSFVCLSVSDTGTGIPPEVLPKIFEPFFTTKEVGQGTGLGLATVFGIVQQHQGWVNVYSEVGQGTTFRVYLPRIVNASEPPEEGAASVPARGGPETILIVEDNAALRLALRKTLGRLGYQVLDAANGPEALLIWKENRDRIDLLLTDLVMPGGLTGKELAARCLKENPGLKVIYSSGYSAEVVGKDFPLSEDINFLTKPYPARKLAKIIRDSLDRI
jgi:PAS domain S-box-containing protein